MKIENKDFINVLGKGDVVVDTPTNTKIISDVLYVSEINESLLSVRQMLEKKLLSKFF